MSDSLRDAVLSTFDGVHPHYLATIVWRYEELYGVPEREAVKAIRKGYSSPGAAMADKVIKWRPYKGQADNSFLFYRDWFSSDTIALAHWSNHSKR